MMTFLEAIAREEGFNAAGSRPKRNNNPGDLEYHVWMQPYGAVPETLPDGEPSRFAKFSTVEEGFACMKSLLKGHVYKGKTVAEALNIWAAPIQNKTNIYIANVCNWVGCKPTDCIDPLVEAS